MKIITPGRTEIDIKRPDGTIETKDITEKFSRMNDILFKKMIEANRQAGRGEVLRYRNVEAVVETEESDHQGHCDRCHGKIDKRTAYKQQEWGRLGGSKVKVTAYYCADCHSLLSSIGAGEVTDLEHRAGYIPSFEPAHKEDF